MVRRFLRRLAWHGRGDKTRNRLHQATMVTTATNGRSVLLLVVETVGLCRLAIGMFNVGEMVYVVLRTGE